ncbi:uncharacterized protein LOC131547244 isoform X5 [Onychostoma macrolepis]|uniref:uncharacterized protein LOC131547244 isoform X5 n=1 Tax=Onychostoma macrolepis TaxID=369639 RepID=UPI00272CDB39|nr:uncharacterized protein LOC131547244 isoform X5 [Onychostoma macrolepis]
MSTDKMDKIFILLQKFRLDKYYKKFIDLGIEEELDFFDSVNDVTLKSMGNFLFVLLKDFSQAERNRYDHMVAYLQRIGSAPVPEMQGMPAMKSLNSFHISYRFPKFPGIQEITGIDPSQNTVEDLMLRICHENKVDRNMSVCLYTADGMPLTDDPFFNTWSLNDRHIASGSELYAIFTPRENLTELPPTQRQANFRNEGPSVIRCHIMLQGDFEIKVDLESDTLRDVTLRLSLESSIPAPVLHIRGEEYNHVDKLSELGITEDSVLQFFLSTFDNEKPSPSLLFQKDVKPSVKQTEKGLSVFLSTLYAIKRRHCGDEFKKVVAYIRRLSGCNALAQSLLQMICGNLHVTRNQKIAVVEGLYFLFRELLPGLNERSGPKVIEDGDVFEYANICWVYLITRGQNESTALEIYATISLKAYPTGQRLFEPVRVPGTPEVFDRSYILEKITDGVKIPNCEEVNLLESSIQRAKDIEKILLSLPASFDRFPLWIFYNSTPQGCNSMSNPATIARKLMASNIVVDAVIVGTADNTVLHGISYVTGGYCFKPENAKAALRLFEMETVLSMELRAERTRVPVSSIKTEEDLTKLFATHGYDERPEMKIPAQITEKAARTENVLKKKIRECKSGRFMEKDKRIIEELKSLHCDPHPFCFVYPSETDFTFWKIVMKGPPETPYENGTFELYCQFGRDYPVKPPAVRFYTPIYHCNINSVGRICHNIFDRNYSADVTMREILDAVYGLLILPEAGDPLDSILAEEFLTSKEIYEQAAKDNTAVNACQSMESIEKQYIGESNVQVPPHLVCPLSGKIFVDPVKTKGGCVYERRAIEEYLKTNNNDPVTGKPLSCTDLTPDKNMKKSVVEYRTSQIVETDP